MFGRMMNNYYYGKSGKGDFRKEDLPHNRRELFTETLKTRLSGLCRINLLYMLIFLPAMIVIMFSLTNYLSNANTMVTVQENDYQSFVEMMAENEREVTISEEEYNNLRAQPPKEIAGLKVTAVRDYLKGIRTENGREEPTGLPKSDVLYFELEKGCWVCVRPSGTEPKIKLYVNSNAAEKADAEALNAKLCEASKAMMA